MEFVLKVRINNIPTLVQIRLGSDQATRHYLNQWWLVYERIDASLRLNEFTTFLVIKARYCLHLAPAINPTSPAQFHVMLRPQDRSDDKAMLVKVMVWHFQAANNFPTHCRPNFMTPNGLSRSQRVNTAWLFWARHFTAKDSEGMDSDFRFTNLKTVLNGLSHQPHIQYLDEQ